MRAVIQISTRHYGSLCDKVTFNTSLMAMHKAVLPGFRRHPINSSSPGNYIGVRSFFKPLPQSFPSGMFFSTTTLLSQTLCRWSNNAAIIMMIGLSSACNPDSPPKNQSLVSAPDSDARQVGSNDSVGAEVHYVYVPVYSHIYHQDSDREFDLTATLSIRNTDAQNSIVVSVIDYYDSNGRLLRSYVEDPVTLGSLSSRAYVVAERDKAGGVGANFIVGWSGPDELDPPIIEAVMVGTANTQGISFISSGQEIQSPHRHHSSSDENN